jgi:hypothetical protein
MLIRSAILLQLKPTCNFVSNQGHVKTSQFPSYVIVKLSRHCSCRRSVIVQSATESANDVIAFEYGSRET